MPTSPDISPDTNPGSFNEFSARHPELSGDQVVGALSDALAAHRAAIASNLGVDVETLHIKGPERILSDPASMTTGILQNTGEAA